jgi:hypothetical protein
MITPMHARLVDGPGKGKDKDFKVADPPPHRAYFVAGGHPFGPEAHRYQLSGVDRDPKTSEPVATYKHGGQVPDNA